VRAIDSFARFANALAAAATAAALAACQPMPGPQASRQPVAEQKVEDLVARCVDAMTRDVCVAQKQEAGGRSTPAASQVFVAGTGAIDAKAYSEIRASGEAMCSLVKTRCAGDWGGSACKTARSLWPAAGRS
jgi:hypothetical protein